MQYAAQRAYAAQWILVVNDTAQSPSRWILVADDTAQNPYQWILVMDDTAQNPSQRAGSGQSEPHQTPGRLIPAAFGPAKCRSEYVTAIQEGGFPCRLQNGNDSAGGVFDYLKYRLPQGTRAVNNHGEYDKDDTVPIAPGQDHFQSSSFPVLASLRQRSNCWQALGQ